MAMEYASWPVEQPSTQARIGSSPRRELGENLSLERVEGFRVTENTRHADERAGVEGVAFFGVAPEEMGVALSVFSLFNAMRRVMRRCMVVDL
jgi:hypothetical protein